MVLIPHLENVVSDEIQIQEKTPRKYYFRDNDRL